MFTLNTEDVLAEEPGALSLSPHPEDQDLARVIQRQETVLRRRLRQRGVDADDLTSEVNDLVREMHLVQVLVYLYSRAVRTAGDRFDLLKRHYEGQLEDALASEALGVDADGDGVDDGPGSGRLRVSRLKGASS